MNRYKRQLAIIGPEGQQLISNATILVVGAGGIGSPVLTYLAAAGVGKIILVDKDKVELSNLHRQILFNENDIGLYKATRAREYLMRLNSSIVVEAFASELNIELSHQLIPAADLVIDGTDNYETRYLINDSCVLSEKPFISSSVLKDIVQVVLFNTKKMCYRCVYPKAPPAGMIPNCEEAGVLGTVTGIAGTLSANLALHYLLKLENCNDSVMRIFNAMDFSLASLPINPNSECPICNQKNASLDCSEIYIDEFGVLLDDIDRNEYFLVDIREPSERDIIKLEDDLFFPIKDNFNYDFFLNYKEKKILIYCAKGYRSKIFALELRERGVNAFYLKDGVSK